VLVRVRFSETDPGKVTGYTVTLPGHTGAEGAPRWYGGGRLAAGLTLPQLRYHWAQAPSRTPGRGAAFRFTDPERDTIYQHASRQAAQAAKHIRRCAYSDPASAADAAWAAADTLHVAARALRSPALRCAADAYDRAARAGYGRIPRRSRDGDRLRASARLLAMTGDVASDTTLLTAALIANLAALAGAVAELRQARQHAAQAAAAHSAAQRMKAAMTQALSDRRRQRHRHARARGGDVPTARRGVPGDLAPMPASQFAVLPGTSHAAVTGRADMLMTMIPPFLDTP
jgi:hypothetical protein